MLMIKKAEKEKRYYKIIVEVAILFLIGVITTGILTYVSETNLSDKSVKKQTEIHAAKIAEEARFAVTEYPAYQWLIQYWYTHPDSLEIEYDADFGTDNQTAEKCRILSERHPGIQIRYLSEDQILALPAEDQKLYAEIAYSWLITRVDQIKQSYQVNYLFCVISEEPFGNQFFLFSAADPGAIRGTSYEEVYPLGNTVSVAESQALAMQRAVQHSSHLADAGNYVDYYTLLCSFDEHNVLIGLTYDLSELRADIASQTWTGAKLAILNHLALSAICLVLILIFVIRPLKRVQHYIRQYKKTKDSEAAIAGLAKIRSRNEIGQLAGDVSDLARAMNAYISRIETITAEKERISTELSLATRIQADMLPSSFPAFPGRTEFDIYAVMDPAKEVGGDFYDYFLIDDDHLCLVMADVSGKGVPAALFMMASKIILANTAMMGRSPAQILTDTNAAICSHNQQEMFVTVWLGILEISTGRLTAANAGHEYPVLKQPDGKFELLKNKHGFVIGGMDGVKYREYELTLAPGSKLFLYTDGVPEATDAQGALFGTERMLSALNSDPYASPDQVLKNVREGVDGFVKEAEQFDDLTMLCFEYRGTPGSKSDDTAENK